MTGNHLDTFTQAQLASAEGMRDPQMATASIGCQCSSAGAAGATTGIIRG